MSHSGRSVFVQPRKYNPYNSTSDCTDCRDSVPIRKVGLKLWSPGCLALIVVTGMLAYLCPAYAQTNLVQDPGFEKQSNTEGAALVSPWSGQGPGQTYSDIGSPHSGTHDGSMQSNNGSSTVTNIVQTIPVTASTNYTLSGWFTVASGSISSGEFGARTTAGAVIAQTAVSSSLTSYKQLTVTFSSGSSTSIVIFGGAILGANSILRTDDLSLTASGAPPPDPKVTSISPASGPTTGGTVAAVYGSGFESGASVTYGSTKSTAVTFISSTEVTAMTPAESVGTVSVTITNPDNGTGSMSNAFTYTAGPTISSISPNSGASTGGTTVTISGSGFKSGATVALGAFLATSVSVLSSTQIQAVTPAEPAGTVSVTITNSDLGTATLPSAFTFSGGGGGQPTITSATTDPGAANSSATCVNQLPLGATKMCTLTINGSNLSGASVTIDGVAATNVVSSSSQVTATVPTSSKTDQYVNLSVTTSGGTTTLTNGFFYGKIYWQTNFSSGTLSSLTLPGCNGTGTVGVSSSITTNGDAYSGQQNYVLPANLALGNYDNDCYFNNSSVPSTTHIFMRGFVYFQTPNPNGYDPGYQDRKLLYINPGVGGGATYCVAGALSSTTSSNAGPDILNCGNTSSNSPGVLYYGSATFNFNQWYEYEMESQMNTVGQYNGYGNLWVNGNIDVAKSNLDVRDSGTGVQGDDNTAPFETYNFGQQIDTEYTTSSGWKESRYWSDLVVADAYIP